MSAQSLLGGKDREVGGVFETKNRPDHVLLDAVGLGFAPTKPKHHQSICNEPNTHVYVQEFPYKESSYQLVATNQENPQYGVVHQREECPISDEIHKGIGEN